MLYDGQQPGILHLQRITHFPITRCRLSAMAGKQSSATSAMNILLYLFIIISSSYYIFLIIIISFINRYIFITQQKHDNFSDPQENIAKTIHYRKYKSTCLRLILPIKKVIK